MPDACRYGRRKVIEKPAAALESARRRASLAIQKTAGQPRRQNRSRDAMDLNFTKDELAFRAEVRRFIAENFDAEMRAAMKRTRTRYIAKHLHIRWQKKLNEKGRPEAQPHTLQSIMSISSAVI